MFGLPEGTYGNASAPNEILDSKYLSSQFIPSTEL